jgi:hypothetical protein
MKKETAAKEFGSYIAIQNDATDEEISMVKEMLLEQITATIRALDPFIVKGPEDYEAEGGFDPVNQGNPTERPDMKDIKTIGWKISIDMPRE